MNSADDGQEQDRSGEGNHLDETSGDTVVRSSDVPSGYGGYSKDFESGETEILVRAAGSVSAGLNQATNTLSMVAWIKPESSTANIGIAAHTTSSPNQSWGVDLNAGNQALVKISSDGTSVSDYTSTSTCPDSAWSHIAVTFSGSEQLIRYYVNGVLADQDATTQTKLKSVSAPLWVGAANGYFDGLIDEVAIFGRLLNDSEIADIYANGIDGTKGGSD